MQRQERRKPRNRLVLKDDMGSIRTRKNIKDKKERIHKVCGDTDAFILESAFQMRASYVCVYVDASCVGEVANPMQRSPGVFRYRERQFNAIV